MQVLRPDPHLVCAVHPQGVEGKCLDFRQDPNSWAGEGEQWSPEGYSWWDGELLPNRPVTLTPEEQLKILDCHPFFTGFCLKYVHQFDRNNLSVGKNLLL
jgi:hypothetical protein